MKIELQTLKRLYVDEKKTQIEIATMYGMTKPQIYCLLREYKIKKDKKEEIIPYKKWTQEEEDYLTENIGLHSYTRMAKKLNRTTKSIRQKRFYMGLEDPRFSDEFVTLHYIGKNLNIDPRVVKKWTQQHGLKMIIKIITNTAHISRIKLSDFWKWAENHQELINWNRFEMGKLGAEPQWTIKARLENKTPKKRYEEWTTKDDELLKSYCKLGISNKKIAENLKRTVGAIRSRSEVVFNIKRRKSKLWNEETKEELKKFVEQGLRPKEIAVKMGRTTRSIENAKSIFITKQNSLTY